MPGHVRYYSHSARPLGSPIYSTTLLATLLDGELQGRRQVLATNQLPFTLQLAVEWIWGEGRGGFACRCHTQL